MIYKLYLRLNDHLLVLTIEQGSKFEHKNIGGQTIVEEQSENHT